MTLSIWQKFLVVITRLGIFLLWLVDYATSLDKIRFGKKSAKIFTIVLSGLFVSFLIFSYITKFGAKVADGYFAGSFQFFPKEISYKKELPILINSASLPVVTSRAYVVADKKTGKILQSYDATQKLPPASTAKLMTALVALDIYNLDEIVTVPEICTTIESTKVWLPVDGRFAIKDLIYSMLIGSAGDSACVLSVSKIPYENFVSLMNRKAALIGLTDTHFSNPIGLDDEDGQNYSTPKDLLTLSEVVMKNPVISDAVKTAKFDLESVDKKFIVAVYSTNQLLYEIPNTLGIKTGTTESAGEVFIYDYADEEKDLIIVVMGSRDRFTDTKNLLSWVLRSYSWK